MTQEVASLSPPQQQLLLLSYCPPIIESCSQVVSPTAASHLCCSWLLLGCCIVVHRVAFSVCHRTLACIIRPLTLSLPATFDTNHQPLPSGSLAASHCPPLLLPSLVGSFIVVPHPQSLLSSCRPLLLSIIDRCSRAVLSPAVAHHSHYS
jgi:hypothetical protein